MIARAGTTALVLLIVGGIAYAHVTVMPRESRGGASERYTVRVPTEGQVATTAVTLDIPAGVTVTDVVQGSGYAVDVRREGGRIVAITWKQEIPPAARAEFVFVATNPASGQIVWKAKQQFADGTTADWFGPAGDRRPASVTTVTPASGGTVR
jgi:uncharacterized protein YcnI